VNLDDVPYANKRKPAPEDRQLRMFQQAHIEQGCIPNSAGYCPCPLAPVPEGETPDLVCSDVGDGLHMPVIDIDFPIQAVESATPGHYHLYINKEVEWDKYKAMLEAMASAGIVQWQWVDTTRERGYSSVRHPSKPKEPGK
jgi:hypothetical protein